jgi:hypothetical protein
LFNRFSASSAVGSGVPISRVLSLESIGSLEGSSDDKDGHPVGLILSWWIGVG